MTKRKPKVWSTKEAVVQAAEPADEVIPSQVKAEEPEATVAPDPDEEFMKRIASLPLDRATLEVRLEVGRRIKASEVGRAKPIHSAKEDGKTISAYAVKQPSVQEIVAMTRPFKLLLEQQTNPAAKEAEFD